jgi:hypothetical protein
MLEYTWDFGDGTSPIVTSDTTIAYTYTAVDTYAVTLTVSDGVAASAQAVTAATIQEAPVGDTKDIYVWDIADAFQTRRRGRNTDYRVVLTVRNDSDGDGIAELSDDAIANVEVAVDLRDANGNLITTLTGTTDANGQFESRWIKGLHPGDYDADVVDLTLSTFEWNPLLDVEDDQLLPI